MPPLPSPPVAAPEPSSGSNVSVPRSNVGWQAGVVGVGMGVASGESSEEIRSGRGAGGADAAAARQVEVRYDGIVTRSRLFFFQDVSEFFVSSL